MKMGNRIVMFLGGVMFIVAGVLKSNQLLTEPILSKVFWESWAFSVVQVPLELGLGIWLVSGLFRKAAHLIATISFGAFVGLTGYLAITGAESCGCFGKVHVNPWVTFSLIDVPLFLGLLIFRVKGEKFFPPPWPSKKHFWSVAIPTVIILGILSPSLAMNKQEREEIIDPDAWGQTEQWAWLDEIDVAGEISSGIVIVLCYRHDCPNCHEAIPIYNEMALELGVGGQDGDMQMAFIEIPPYGPAEDDPIPADSPCVRGKLSEAEEWLVETPVVVVLQDGEVLKVWEGVAPGQDEIFEAVFGGN